RNTVYIWTRHLMRDQNQVALDAARHHTPSFADRIQDYRAEGLDSDGACRAIVRHAIHIDRMNPARLPALPPLRDGPDEWVPGPDWPWGVSRDPVHVFLGLPDYAPGSLSRAEGGVVRAHAAQRRRKLNAALTGQGVPLADRARQLWELRNAVYTWT